MASLKLSDENAVTDDEEHENNVNEKVLEDVTGSGDDDSASESSSRSPMTDTTEEIATAKRAKSKKTLKRKRRATEPSRFGATLESLLSTDVQSTLPLSLKPSVARKRKEEKLELKAKKVQLVEKKEKEDKCRIRDVIGGWGMANERELRKVAQRGVVKLFNVIQQSQHSMSAVAESTKSLRGTGKPTLPAPVINGKRKGGKKKGKDTLGVRDTASVNKDEFFDMIRSGGLVSKT